MSTDCDVPRFGLYLPQIGLSFRQVREIASAAESMGFRHLWFCDHLEIPGCPSVLEGWTIAAAIAAHTSDIRIGHLVLCAGFRHPALLGKMAATFDQISEGRLDLGLGWGGSPMEMRDYGLAVESGALRRAKLAETIAIIRLMLVGGAVDFEGEHYVIHAAPTGPCAVQSPVPVFVGGAGATTMDLVRDHADWWNCPSYGRDDLSRLISLKGTARVSVNYSIAFDETSPTSVRRLGDRCAPILSGTPAAIGEILAADQQLGVELFNIQFVCLADIISQMTTFMKHVAPSVK